MTDRTTFITQQGGPDCPEHGDSSTHSAKSADDREPSRLRRVRITLFPGRYARTSSTRATFSPSATDATCSKERETESESEDGGGVSESREGGQNL